MDELVRQLGINWKLLLAQVINFFVLLYILKKFAYLPLMRVLEKRKEIIRQGLERARKSEEEFAKIREMREGIVKEAQKRAASIIEESRKTGEKRCEEIMAETKRRAAEVVEEAKALINEERNKMLREVRGEMASIALIAAEKLMRERLDSERDRRLADETVRQLME